MAWHSLHLAMPLVPVIASWGHAPWTPWYTSLIPVPVHIFNPNPSTHVLSQFQYTCFIPILGHIFNPSWCMFFIPVLVHMFHLNHQLCFLYLWHSTRCTQPCPLFWSQLARGNHPDPPHLCTCLIPVKVHISSNSSHFHKIYLIFHWCKYVAIPVANFMTP